MENNAQLLKGVLEYCVLRLIEKEPTYGYEIVMQLKQVGFADVYKRQAQTPTGGSSGEYCTMGETLMQRRRVEEEGLRIVNSCC